MRKIFHSTLLLLLLCIPGLNELKAQVSYIATYHAQAGNPGNINQESDQATDGWETVITAGISQNQWSQGISIPFPFSYYGRPIQEFRVSGNGLLSFLSSPQIPAGDNVALPSNQLPDSTIACFWEKFTTSAPTGSNDEVQTKVFGQAPNRQFWTRWTSYEWGNTNFQFVAIVLEESSHDIHLVDMYGNQFGDPVTSTVGLQATSSFAVSYGDANTALNGISPSYQDNSYYTFDTYDIEPYDLDVLAILAPNAEGCGIGNEVVKVRFANVGLLNASGIKASFSVDGAAFSPQESINQSLQPGEEMDYTFVQRADFSGIGAHTLRVLIQVPGDGNISNDSLSMEVNSSISISSFPYEENFEQGNAGWSAGGENSSWELAYPNAGIMQGAFSGVNAWVTNPGGNYNNLEKSYVSSPCFNLSNAHPDLHISMNIWWETEYSWDGAVLQATVDRGDTWFNIGEMNSSENWFNDNTIGALPGGSSIGWTGTAADGNGSGGWVKVQHPLGPALVGQPQVRFRIAFASDNGGFAEGLAFDNVMIAVPPQINLGADRFFCEGSVLKVNEEQGDILWSNGAKTKEIILSHTGTSPMIDSLITVSVTDAQGLVGKDSIYVSMTPHMQFEYAVAHDIACAGEENGSISLDISGGSTPLIFEWSHGEETSTIEGLSTGTYVVVVRDLNGCEIDSSFTIQSDNPELFLEYTTAHAACDGTPIGSITLNASGGAGGYNYSWNTGGAGSQRENLEAGSYIVSTSDQIGCTRIDTILVEQAGDLSINIQSTQNPSCQNEQNGAIQIEIQGGSGSYDIFWDHGPTTTSIDLLGAGSYSGYVVDSEGCNKLLPNIQLEPETAPSLADFDYTISGSTIGFTDLSRHTETYLWDFGDGTAPSTVANPAHFYLNNGSYTVTLIASNSCGSDTISQEISMQTVGLDEIFADNIQVFPNPFSDRVQVNFEEATSEAYSIKLLNVHGQLMYQETGNKGAQKHTLQFPRDLSQGIYMLRIAGSNGQSVLRILKQ